MGSSDGKRSFSEGAPAPKAELGQRRRSPWGAAPPYSIRAEPDVYFDASA